jgi:hypothetical protein
MQGDPTFAGGALWALSFLGDIAFRWIPGTVLVLSGAAPESAHAPILPITRPVTTSDIVDFLQAASQPGAFDQLFHYWSLFVALSILASLLFGAGVIYCLIRIMQIRHNEHARFAAATETIHAKDVSKTQLRWNRIQEEVSSDDEQKWRLAILEADIMLSELLDVLGYRGETMSDKMKAVPRGDFNTIDLAWEAHRARNQIAHEGSMYQLSEREARRIIGLYERVFREFKFIQ